MSGFVIFNQNQTDVCQRDYLEIAVKIYPPFLINRYQLYLRLINFLKQI
jgi:hypothetical protein